MKLLIALLNVTTVTCLVSCGKLTEYNTEWCRDKGELGAHCNWTHNGPATDVAKIEWDEKRFGMFCTSEQGFAANQLFFEQACEKTKGCNVEELKKKYAEFLKLMRGM